MRARFCQLSYTPKGLVSDHWRKILVPDKPAIHAALHSVMKHLTQRQKRKLFLWSQMQWILYNYEWKKTTNNNKTAETFTGSTVQACIESHKWPNKELTNALVYVRTNQTFFNFLIIFFCTETASRPFHNKCTVKSISIHQEGPGGKKKKEKRNFKKVRKTLKDLKSHTGAVLCVPRHRCLF